MKLDITLAEDIARGKQIPCEQKRSKNGSLRSSTSDLGCWGFKNLHFNWEKPVHWIRDQLLEVRVRVSCMSNWWIKHLRGIQQGPFFSFFAVKRVHPERGNNVFIISRTLMVYIFEFHSNLRAKKPKPNSRRFAKTLKKLECRKKKVPHIFAC